MSKKTNDALTFKSVEAMLKKFETEGYTNREHHPAEKCIIGTDREGRRMRYNYSVKNGIITIEGGKFLGWPNGKPARDSAAKTWAITQDMMQGRFVADAEYGKWGEPFKNPDQTQIRFYRENRNGKVVGIKEIKSKTGGLRKIEVPLEEVDWHLSKDAGAAKDPRKMSRQEISAEMEDIKQRMRENARKLSRSSKDKAELQELGDRWRELAFYLKSNSEENTKDADSKNDLKYKLRNALMGAQASEKSLANLLSSNGFSKIQKLSGYSFKGENSRGLKMGITYKPIDPDNKTFKVKEVWFEDAKSTRDGLESEASFRAEYMSILKKANDLQKQAQMAYKRDDLAKGDSLWKAFYKEADKLGALVIAGNKRGYTEPKERINYYPKPIGDSKMTGANYRPSLDAVAAKDAEEPWVVFTLNGKELVSYTVRGTFPGELQATKESLAYENGVDVSQIKHKIVVRKHAKDAAADGRETWKWDTMFMDLAEKVYNKLQMAGITSNVRKNGQYYHIEAKVTPDERKKIEFFIKGHTIHSVGGYRSMDYPGK